MTKHTSLWCWRCEKNVEPKERETGWTTTWHCPHCWTVLDSKTCADGLHAELEALTPREDNP